MNDSMSKRVEELEVGNKDLNHRIYELTIKYNSVDKSNDELAETVHKLENEKEELEAENKELEKEAVIEDEVSDELNDLYEEANQKRQDAEIKLKEAEEGLEWLIDYANTDIGDHIFEDRFKDSAKTIAKFAKLLKQIRGEE